MKIEIKDNTNLLLDGEKIYHSDRKIKKVEILNNNKVIIRLKASEENLLCIDMLGQILWKAESISPVEYIPYQDFTIIDGKLHATALMPVFSVDATIDAETGKVIAKENFR